MAQGKKKDIAELWTDETLVFNYDKKCHLPLKCGD